MRKKNNKPIHNKSWLSFIFLSLSIGLFSGCHEDLDLSQLHPEEEEVEQPTPDDNNRQPDTKTPDDVDAPITRLKSLVLNKTNSCNEYTDYLAEVFTEYLANTPRYRYGCPECDVVALPADASAEAGSANTQNESMPDNVSGTNNQEQGVNEADIVKTDSEGNLYVINDNWFVIEDAFPAENMSELSRLDLGAHTNALFFSESEQLAFVVARVAAEIIPVNDHTTAEPVAVEPNLIATDALVIAPEYYRNRFELIVIDVTNKTAPIITDRKILDGNYINSRRIENRIHLISQFDLRVPQPIRETPVIQDILNRIYDPNISEENKNGLRIELKTAIRSKLAEIGINELTPALEQNTVTEPLLACDALYHPEVIINYPRLLMVTSLNMDGSALSSSAIVAQGYITYASQENLYISQPSWGWWWFGNNEQQTVIHQFTINENEPAYLATGHVPGTVNDQFSFSEHKGHLRVTTTETHFDAQTGNRSSTNRLQVLQNNNDGELVTVGKVEDFAPGERIFSNRFMGDRGFVVTFRQTDPLFSFDLSDPKEPKLLGELEIPGFSDYMQPIDENHLLTIGKNGDANGAGDHVQLQIFDISDLTSPQLLHKFIPFEDKAGYSWSPANYNHLAFNYFAPGKVLAIPFTYNDWQRNDFFNGILSVGIDLETGITPISRVDHTDFIDPTNICTVEGKILDDGTVVCPEIRRYWGPVRPTRTVIMQEAEQLYLYSLSRAGIKATTLDENSQLLSAIRLPHRSNF